MAQVDLRTGDLVVQRLAAPAIQSHRVRKIAMGLESPVPRALQGQAVIVALMEISEVEIPALHVLPGQETVTSPLVTQAVRPF